MVSSQARSASGHLDGGPTRVVFVAGEEWIGPWKQGSCNWMSCEDDSALAGLGRAEARTTEPGWEAGEGQH